MSDLSLTGGLVADLSIYANDLRTDSGLESAVLISLFTDRRAELSDVLPDGETSRRGWWADDPTDKIGSRLWMLERLNPTPSVLRRHEEYAREALAWLKTDGVADQINVTATANGGRVTLAIEVKRPNMDASTYSYDLNWQELNGL